MILESLTPYLTEQFDRRTPKWTHLLFSIYCEVKDAELLWKKPQNFLLKNLFANQLNWSTYFIVSLACKDTITIHLYQFIFNAEWIITARLYFLLINRDTRELRCNPMRSVTRLTEQATVLEGSEEQSAFRWIKCIGWIKRGSWHNKCWWYIVLSSQLWLFISLRKLCRWCYSYLNCLTTFRMAFRQAKWTATKKCKFTYSCQLFDKGTNSL